MASAPESVIVGAEEHRSGLQDKIALRKLGRESKISILTLNPANVAFSHIAETRSCTVCLVRDDF